MNFSFTEKELIKFIENVNKTIKHKYYDLGRFDSTYVITEAVADTISGELKEANDLD